jgi:serine/threonine-protein kinase
MSAAADRHLLFGLLALQIGLVDQAQLVAAFQAWTRDKARPLTDHLVTRGGLDEAERAGIEAMVALHLKKHGGDPEQSLAAIPTPLSTREHLSKLQDPEIQATLGRVASGHAGTERDPAPDSERTTDYASNATSSPGLRFRLLRPHAKGGLGAVFVALDQELHREVALKQILETHADDPTSRARFLLEAEVTGSLEHPGVVPVYSLGAYADGRPFYAMRFIRGESLKEAIEHFHDDVNLKANPGQRSLELRKLLRRFVDVCNAIDYAHSRGVLHRDIKPRNIIVGKYGETLVVDWGLAKATGKSEPGAGERTLVPSSSGSSSETLPGSALGTPAYMSPEQGRGELDQLGPRSDVYSLGATLYCLLTGKPPQEGDDLGEILRRSQTGEFPRPRQVDPAIDPALEAICLKAMALQPRDRHASARMLADDLESWMADEPVSAWSEPWTRKLSRWVSRNRTGVAAAAATVLAGVVGLSAVLGVQSAANARLTESLQRETAANDELKRSRAAVQARYDLAVEAIKTFHTGVLEDFLIKEDQFKDLRNRLLQTASDFYARLGGLLGKETDVASRRALARSNFELAELTSKVGRPEAALAAHQAVLKARETLASENEADTESKLDVGRSLMAVAGLLSFTGKTSEALTMYRQAESLLQGMAASDPSTTSLLGACRSQIGEILFRTNRPEEALKAYRLARSEQAKLAETSGASSLAQLELATTVDRMAFLLLYYSEMTEAEDDYRAALEIRKRLADGNPDSTQFLASLARGYRSLGTCEIYTDETKGAEENLRKAMAIYSRLAIDHPAVTDFAASLAATHYYLGWLLNDLGRLREAEVEIREARRIQGKLLEDNPSVTRFRDLMAMVQSFLGNVLRQTGRSSDAEAECRAGLSILDDLVRDNPSSMTIVNHVPHAIRALGDVERSRGRPAEARILFDRMVTLTEPPVLATPNDPEYLSKFVGALWRRGLTRRDLGDLAGAEADARRAIEESERLPARTIRYKLEKAFSLATLAGLVGRTGSKVTKGEGEAAADRAMEWLRRAATVGYANVSELRIEAAFDSLRNRPDFQLLLLDLAFPADPLARGESDASPRSP